MVFDMLTVINYDHLQSTIVALSNYVMASILPAQCLNLFDIFACLRSTDGGNTDVAMLPDGADQHIHIWTVRWSICV